MSDKIPSITESKPKDRAGINVGGRKFNKRIIILVAFVLAALLIVFIGGFFAFRNAETVDEKEEEIKTVENFSVGKEESKINDSDSYFERIRREKERRDALLTAEKKRKKEAEQKIIEAEEKRIEAEKKVKYTNSLSPEKERTVPVSVARNNPQTTAVDTPVVPARTMPRPKSSDGMTPAERRLQGSVLVNAGSGGSSSLNAPKEVFNKNFNAYKFQEGSASVVDSEKLDYLLIHGTSIPCALKTQIISDYEGFVTCQVTQDVYSANGATLLVEKGSIASGTQSVSMEPGKSRVFTTWGDIQTPNGVSIQVDSLGTGALGASGIDAWVDTHFAQRFGGAILLSFIDDSLSALSDRLADNDGAQFDNSTNTGANMAQTVLDSSINISDTGYAFIGQRINIMVARDVDLSTVYKLRKDK